MILPSTKPGPAPDSLVSRYADSEIPTAHGPITTVVYREVVDGRPVEDKEHVALLIGDALANPAEVLARVHSECLTSEVFGSLKCDCRQQFDHAVQRAFEAGGGIVVYLRQEGRGIGLGNKIRAYSLQARGADTVQANHQLGFETDLRSYDIAAAILEDLGVKGVALMTNNPDKVRQLEQNGINVVRREPVLVQPNIHSEKYLHTKRDKCGHLID